MTERKFQGKAVWTKATPAARDRLQSRILVCILVPLLALGVARTCLPSSTTRPLLFPLAFSLCFAALVWGMRSATGPAAAVGFLVCISIARGTRGLPALVTMFLLTFAATRFGRRAKEARGLGEARTGRRASQVAANLGIAGLCAAMGWYPACIAALAEAAADTVSSEVGQAVGGPVRMIPTLKRAPVGTDGGVSMAGTLAGVVAAALVAVAGCFHGRLPIHTMASVTLAGCAGLLFDSMLGATVERRGWLGNDWVNFLSTGFSASLVWLLR